MNYYVSSWHLSFLADSLELASDLVQPNQEQSSSRDWWTRENILCLCDGECCTSHCLPDCDETNIGQTQSFIGPFIFIDNSPFNTEDCVCVGGGGGGGGGGTVAFFWSRPSLARGAPNLPYIHVDLVNYKNAHFCKAILFYNFWLLMMQIYSKSCI